MKEPGFRGGKSACRHARGSDYRRHSTTGRSVSSITEAQGLIFMGADPGSVDTAGGDAASDEVLAYGAEEIHVGARVAGSDECTECLCVKGFGDFRSDLEAVRSDRGTDSGDQVPGTSSE